MKNLILFTTAFFYFFTVSCSNEEVEKNETMTIINKTNNENSENTFTSNRISGSITTENSEIVMRGICWSKNQNPTINDANIKLEENNFSYVIEKLTANTTYYYRIFAINNQGIKYGDNSSFKTLSFSNTNWKFGSLHTRENFLIESKVNFYSNGTTKFDEIGPGQGFFITNGTWSLNGNQITYIWSGNQPENSTYVYNGIISGMTITGTFSHPSVPGTFTASILN